MSPLHVRDGATWKEVNGLHVRDGSVWKEVNEGHVRDGSVWKQFLAGLYQAWGTGAFSSSRSNGNVTLSNGDKTATSATFSTVRALGDSERARGSSTLHFLEFRIDDKAGNITFGWAKNNASTTGQLGASANQIGFASGSLVTSHSTRNVVGSAPTFANNDVMGLAMGQQDGNWLLVHVFKNGTLSWEGEVEIFSSGAFDPTFGASFSFSAAQLTVRTTAAEITTMP